MLQYNGSSSQIRQCIERFGERLDAIYADILGVRRQDVERLSTPGLIYTPSKNVEIREPVLPCEIKRNREVSGLSMLSAMLGLIEETLTKELDRRVLGGLGYNPDKWVNGTLEGPIDPFNAQIHKLQAHLRGMPNEKLVQFVGDYHNIMKLGYDFLLKFYGSLKKFNFEKSATETIGDLEQLVSGGVSGYAMAVDNFFAAVVDKSGEIKVYGDGRVQLRSTSTIKSAPFIMLSDDAIQNTTAMQLAGTDLPPELVAIVHEYDHFVGYCIQKIPLNIAMMIIQLRIGFIQSQDKTRP
jgi:hypothetical protein